MINGDLTTCGNRGCFFGNAKAISLLESLRNARNLNLSALTWLPEERKYTQQFVEFEEFLTNIRNNKTIGIKVVPHGHDMDMVEGVEEEVRGEFVARHALRDELDQFTTYVDYNHHSCFNLTWESDHVKWSKIVSKVQTAIHGIAIVLQTDCQRDLSAENDYEYSDSEINEIRTQVTEFFTRFHEYAVHLDIKPGNIVYCATSNNYRIIDFGTAAVLETAEDDTNNTRGMLRMPYTPLYASSTWMAYKIDAKNLTTGDLDGLINIWTKLPDEQYTKAVERLKDAKVEEVDFLDREEVVEAAKEHDRLGLELTIGQLKKKKVATVA